MRTAILINGVPASGKSTVCEALVKYLTENGMPAVPLSLDIVKERLFAHIGAGDRDHNRLLGRASYDGIFASVAAFPENLVPVVDAWHGFQPAETLRSYLDRAEIGLTVEIWCRVRPSVAAERYRVRAKDRPRGHPSASYAEELYDLAGRARPLALGPVIEIDTERPIRDEDLAEILTCARGQSTVR